jgi:hypothetical protein
MLTWTGSELNEDGKSLKNPQQGVLSQSYSEFTDGITNGTRGGFDVHIYYFQVCLVGP